MLFLIIKDPSIQGQEPVGSQNIYLLLFPMMNKGNHCFKSSTSEASISTANSDGSQKHPGSHNRDNRIPVLKQQ